MYQLETRFARIIRISCTVDVEGGLLIGNFGTFNLGDDQLTRIDRKTHFRDYPFNISWNSRRLFTETAYKLELSKQLASGTFNQ